MRAKENARVVGRDMAQASTPLIAYVLLWFPLSSETFIFREIRQLRKLGMRIEVFTLYGKSLKGCSEEMKNYPVTIRRMGIKACAKIISAFFRAMLKRPAFVLGLAKQGLFRRMRNLESLAENTWAFFAGFLLAEQCAQGGVDLIHSSWANGPATAAWIASRLSGIPFAFTGRAGDIYPEDGILAEKARDALFIRTNNAANVRWLAGFCPKDQKDKVALVYNSLTFANTVKTLPETPASPLKILAVGRFVRTKGFPFLLTALARLKRENFPVCLTLVGDGAWRKKLEKMRARLNLEDCVQMPGFLPNDTLPAIMSEHDALVVPSVVHSNGDRDGIPNVIMEAMSMNLPVIATDVCGISEIVRNGQTGFLVRQKDAAALANAVRQLAANWPEAVRMAKAGRSLVAEMFNPESNGQALQNLYLGRLEKKGQTN